MKEATPSQAKVLHQREIEKTALQQAVKAGNMWDPDPF